VEKHITARQVTEGKGKSKVRASKSGFGAQVKKMGLRTREDRLKIFELNRKTDSQLQNNLGFV
jgi:hypothetical protein